MYVIEITQTEEVDVTKREYEKIADSGNEKDGGAVYGYVQYPSKETKKTTVLLQTVEDEAMDITAVIKAINRIP